MLLAILSQISILLAGLSSGIHSRHPHHQYLTGNHHRHPRHLRRRHPCRQHQFGRITRRHQSLLLPPQTTGWSTLLMSVRWVSVLPGSTDGEEGPDTGNLIGVGLAAAVTTGDLLTALTTLFPRPTAAPSRRSTRRQSRPCRRVGHLVSHMTVDGTPAAKGPHYFSACMFC